MSRGLRLSLIVCSCLVAVGAAFLWALPEIVRRVALDQIPKRTGRAVAINDIDLNLFTGHLGIKKFRLTDRGSPEFFVELERLDVRLSLPALLRSHVHLAEIALTGPSIRVVRTGPGALNFSDLLGPELRSFKLPRVDPYAAANIGWVIKKGELQYKVRFTLDGDQLTAHNEVVVGQLQVAPAKGTDEVKQRIGLPLGLIVALIKDQRGDIRANVPVTGAVNDPKFDLRDTIWTAIKNVLVNIVTAPFKAIGRLFSGGEEPRVEPVTFAAGSSVLSPAMEDHLLRVADFLRGAPFVGLALRPVPSRSDVEALQSEAVSVRLRGFQKERGLADTEAALAAYYQEQLPGVTLPATLEEQVALLREREAVPDAGLADLGRRRLEATRERLVTAEGIPAARLTVEDAAPGSPTTDPATGDGRVEFGVVAGEE